MTFYYWQGDWYEGRELVFETNADNITQADQQFQSKLGYDPSKCRDVVVTLEKGAQ